MYDTWGGVSIIYCARVEASEVKFPSLVGLVLLTHFPSGSGNLTRSSPAMQLIQLDDNSKVK